MEAGVLVSRGTSDAHDAHEPPPYVIHLVHGEAVSTSTHYSGCQWAGGVMCSRALPPQLPAFPACLLLTQPVCQWISIKRIQPHQHCCAPSARALGYLPQRPDTHPSTSNRAPYSSLIHPLIVVATPHLGAIPPTHPPVWGAVQAPAGYAATSTAAATARIDEQAGSAVTLQDCQ